LNFHLIQLHYRLSNGFVPAVAPPAMLGVPQLVAFLQQRGVDVAVCDMRPGFGAPWFDPATFANDEAVVRFLSEGDACIDAATEELLEALALCDAHYVGMSLACAVESPVNHAATRRPYLNLAACLAKGIKRRKPSTVVLLGGLSQFVSKEDRTWLERVVGLSGAVDHVVFGNGEPVLDELLTNDQARAPVDGHGGAAWWPASYGLDKPPCDLLPHYLQPSVDASVIAPVAIAANYRVRGPLADVLTRDPKPRPLLPFCFVRGCAGRCAFCGQAQSKVRAQPVEQVVDALIETRDRFGCEDFLFINTAINWSKKYATQFCDELIRRRAGLRWSDSVVFHQLDERLLERMKEAGAIRLVLGIECPEEQMLGFIRKNTTLDHAKAMLRRSHELGMWNHLLLIAGLPYETEQTQAAVCDFVDEMGETLDSATVSSFYLPEGSPFHRNPESFGLELLGPVDGKFAFNEKDALSWDQKREQIRASTDRLRRAVSSVLGSDRCVTGALDLDLIYLLARCFGPEGKDGMRAAYRGIFSEVLAHRLAFDRTVHDKLAARGWQLSAPQVTESLDVAEYLLRASGGLAFRLRVGRLSGDWPTRLSANGTDFGYRIEGGEERLPPRTKQLLEAIGRSLVTQASTARRARSALQTQPAAFADLPHD